MYDYIAIPHYSLKPNALTLYERLEGQFQTSGSQKGWDNLKDNTNYFGELSPHSHKRLRNTIDYMIYLSNEKKIYGKEIIAKSQKETTDYQKGKKYKNPVKYKLTFITLTLPSAQVHSDQQIKSKCLNHFLTDLRRKWKVEMYIWKAEKQENGNIHFHILADKYIKWQEIKIRWNQICEKLDYVSVYQKNMKRYFINGFKMSDNPKDKRNEATQRKAYEKSKSENWLNPNSTDIHALYKIKNLAAYLAKYLTKNVTKTDRIIRMTEIRNRVQVLNVLYDKLTNDEFFNQGKPTEIKAIQTDIFGVKKEIKQLINENETLLKQGVAGKIWGSSQILSKCKNFIDVENWSDIVEIQTVAKIKRYECSIEIGSRKITTYFFDINKTPFLKQKLDNHLQFLLRKQKKVS